MTKPLYKLYLRLWNLNIQWNLDFRTFFFWKFYYFVIVKLSPQYRIRCFANTSINWLCASLRVVLFLFYFGEDRSWETAVKIKYKDIFREAFGKMKLKIAGESTPAIWQCTTNKHTRILDGGYFIKITEVLRLSDKNKTLWDKNKTLWYWN